MGEVDLHNRDEGSFEVVTFEIVRVEDFDGVSAAGNSEGRASEEVFRELSASRVEDLAMSLRSGRRLRASVKH